MTGEMMIEVGIRASHRNWVWSFPGDDNALVTAFRAGAFPIHLHDNWPCLPVEYHGELRQIATAPVFDRLINIEASYKGALSGPIVSAVLLTLDHEIRFVPTKGTVVGNGSPKSQSAGFV